MSVCNFVELITPDTCIGDSLATFNKNFQALDEGLCNIPDIVSGTGTVAEALEISEQQHGTIRISTNNSFVYGTTFEYAVSAYSQNLPLLNGTTVPVTVFPLLTGAQDIQPTAIFSTISLTHSLPKITLFWTASGEDTTTLYATNSSISPVDSNLNFNGPITAMLSSGGVVYVGGDFTSVCGKEVKKFCILNLNDGVHDGSYDVSFLNQINNETGKLLGSPLSGDGGFGYNGEIKVIIEHEDLIIFGGNYDSLLVGRGLTAYNKATGQIYPYYVNGEVNSIAVNGTDLYVGGTFDYVNYGATSSSMSLGMRVYTNGLAKINIPRLLQYPNSSIDATFGQNIRKQFNNLAYINSIAVKTNTVFIAGNFQAHQNNELYAENLAIVNFDGFTSLTWRPIVTGEVYKLQVIGDYLYLGGAIKAVHTVGEFFANPRKNQPFYHAACFLVSVPPAPILQTNWQPRFNGAVTNFASQDNLVNTPLYCYGMFTEVNGNPANYIAAVEKSFENSIGGNDLYHYWRVDVDTPPKKINQCILKSGNSLLLGGNFLHINGKKRKHLARINGVFESLVDKPQTTAVLGFGGQVCGPGSNLSLDFTTYYNTTAYASTYGNVAQTTIPLETMSDLFKYSSPGLLYKFFVTRPTNSGTLNADVNIIGWKVDFN